MVLTNRSARGLAGGARTGVLMIGMPSAAKTASKDALNLVSRSRMRNLTAAACHVEVAGLLGHPVGGGMGGDAGDPGRGGCRGG